MTKTTAPFFCRTSRGFRPALAASLLALLVVACGGGSAGSTTTVSTGSTPSFIQTATPTTGTALAEVLTRSATSSATARTPTATELLDWAQTTFPSLFPTASASANQTLNSYTYRTYSSTDFALAVHTDGTVLGFIGISTSAPRSVSLGSLSQFACSVFPASCTTTTSLAQKAGALAAAIGKPKRLLIGLGDVSVADAQAQGIKSDIWEFYLVGADARWDWRTWNQPDGAFIQVFSSYADAMQAVPMFTLYQMATQGNGNISVLADATFMTRYWDNVRVMYERINTYGKPTLVHFEPDLWGYTQRVTSNPSQHYVQVASVNSRCASQPNNMVGFGNCLVQMARDMAPNAKVGFPPSMFGDLVGKEVPYMNAVGANKADFIVMQTLDRDAGCFELLYTANAADCSRTQNEPYYWDDTNTRSVATFQSHFAVVRSLHEGIGLPVLWWQTPLGVPSTTPGGREGAFRDNRVQYFLTHPAELVAAGGVGVVFSAGNSAQTTINTDGGQFRRLSANYLANPVSLP